MAVPSITYDKSLSQLSGEVLSAIRVYILQATLNGETVPTSAQDLVTAAKCYIACIPNGLLDALEVYLLTQIANGGGGGGGSGAVTYGVVDPVAAPSDPTLGALYYIPLQGKLWAWDVAGQAWIPQLA